MTSNDFETEELAANDSKPTVLSILMADDQMRNADGIPMCANVVTEDVRCLFS